MPCSVQFAKIKLILLSFVFSALITEYSFATEAPFSSDSFERIAPPKETKEYYPSGKLKVLKKWNGTQLLAHEEYYENGRDKMVKEWNKSGVLTLEQHFNKKKVMIKQITLKDKGKLQYEYLEWYDNDRPKEKRQYVLDKKNDMALIKHGTWKKLDVKGKVTAEVEYDMGEVVNIVVKEMVPEQYLAFDTDKSGDISQEELESGINLFFDDESTLSLNEIRELIGFYFDQE